MPELDRSMAELHETPFLAGSSYVGRSWSQNSYRMLPLTGDDFEIVSVEPADPPQGMVGSGWHCYIIEQGENTIRGYQQGNLRSVTRSVEEIVARLNDRRYGKRGRVHLDMSSNTRKTERK